MTDHLRRAWASRIERESMGVVTDFLDSQVLFDSMRPGQRPKYPSIAALVRAQGRQFSVAKMTDDEWFDIPRGEMGLCFQNALTAAYDNPELTYVEGYAQSSIIPLHHAWVTDDGKRAIDVTWGSPGGDYFGVPFKTEWVAKTVLKSGYYGVFGELTLDPEWLEKGLPASAIKQL